MEVRLTRHGYRSSPSAVRPDARNLAYTDRKFTSQCNSVTTVRGGISNFLNVCVREFGIQIFSAVPGWTAEHYAKAFGVGAIRGARVPSQIFQTVVRFITVVMTSLKPLRAFTHEGRKDERVQVSIPDLACIVERDTEIALPNESRAKDTFWKLVDGSASRQARKRPNPTVIADLITGPVLDRFPIFHSGDFLTWT